MKKILTTLTLLFTLIFSGFGQYNYYYNDPISGEYDGNMSILTVIYVDGEMQTDQPIEVAAFIDGSLRVKFIGGYINVPNLSEPYNGYYYLPLVIRGITTDNGSLVEFKAYNHAAKEELIIDDNLSDNLLYEDNGIVSISDPIKLYFESTSVARIEEQRYATLAAAVEAAEEGETVTLIKNATGAGVVIDKNITIDFNGKTYSLNEGVGSTGTEHNGFQIKKNRTVTLKNGTLEVAEGFGEEFSILIQNYSNLTITDMTLDGDRLDRNDWSYVLSNNSGNININGNTNIYANVVEGEKHFAFDAYKYSNYAAPIVNLTTTGTISGPIELSGGELYTTKEGLNIVATKEFAANQTVWGTISTPIQNAVIPTIDGFTHDLYAYDEVEQEWEHYKNSDDNQFTSMTLGKGYLYANAGDEKTSVSLEGALNISNVTVALSYTDGNALAGFNMIGNPFSYNISSSNFNTTATLSEGFYVIGANGEWLARPEGTIISPMESVLVKTDVKAALEIVKSGQKRGNMNEEHSYLAVNVSNANYEDLAYVSFGDGKGLDKINHRNSEVPMVYVPVDGKDYAIAVMEEDVVEIPVSFKAATMGEYTIGVEATGCEYAAITLVDRLTGNETNMLLEEYTFVASNKDNVNRFLIQLSMKSDNNDTENFAYINNGMMNINNVEGQGLVRIYDVTGRYVAEYNVFESATISTSEFAAGMYVIQMTDEKGVKVQKIIID